MAHCDAGWSRSHPHHQSNAFAKLKALLCKAAERTRDRLWDAVACAIDAFTPQECANYFTAPGYEPESMDSAPGVL